MSIEHKIKVGDIVQVHPTRDTVKAFAGCLLVVTEVTERKVMGYVQELGTPDAIGERTFYCAPFQTFLQTGGKVAWMPDTQLEQNHDAA